MDITKKVYNYWFNKDNRKWFNSTTEDDLFIKENFEKYLTKQRLLFDEVKEVIAYIILYDQFPRHIYREEIKHELGKKKTFIADYDAIALRLAQFVIKHNLFKFMKPEERVFSLMPLRHSFEEDKIRVCLDLVKKWREEEDIAIYQRFYKATLISLGKQINNKLSRVRFNEYTTIEQIKEILDYYEEDIYLEEHLVRQDKLKKNKIFEMVKRIIGKKSVVLSLSGGVDSIILSYILKHLGIDFIAVSINYTNRETSYIETEFVNRWCYHMRIPLFVRTIDEINRTTKDRQIYEEVTRVTRFDLYKRFNRPIILGHNANDVLENIFSNIKKQQKYDNLDGMSFKSFERGIEILRPMLKIYKREIFEFAHQYKIPYLYDSTPKECERGKMRDILIPQVKAFEPKILLGLEELSTNMKEMYRMFNKVILEKTYEEMVFTETECILDFRDKRDFGTIYWHPVIIYVCKKLRIPYPTNKSIINFVKMIKRGKDCQCILCNYLSIEVKKDKIKIIKTI